jgi:hypothetical protein
MLRACTESIRTAPVLLAVTLLLAEPFKMTGRKLPCIPGDLCVFCDAIEFFQITLLPLLFFSSTLGYSAKAELKSPMFVSNEMAQPPDDPDPAAHSRAGMHYREHRL